MENVEEMTLAELENYITSPEEKDWAAISRNPNLTEEFIEVHADKVDWYWISMYQKLSEEFIEKHADKVDWDCISRDQKLSEEFIERYAGEVDWYWISERQKLSEKFIERHTEEIYWNCISGYQKLSEKFIEKHADKVNWEYISMCQKLSEEFIERHADKVDWYWISTYQKLSEEFIERHSSTLSMSRINGSWNYKSADFKKTAVEATGLYECHKDFFYAYKGIRSDRYSKYNFQYRYMPGETYECFADASFDENSFGLSAWTKEGAEEYCSELVVKVKVYYKDAARVVHNGGKIRCSKLTVME